MRIEWLADGVTCRLDWMRLASSKAGGLKQKSRSHALQARRLESSSLLLFYAGASETL
ncbi:MAG: hypothetical protein RBR69_05415 [Candidatus Cloacimonadaceae bacterium]|nr:hypothetical protein [Candidatus Cloacimonadota bacterium]MDD3533442.1 hypothetical protein [Candidatus Cloacimonadota bacterium]MDY0127549.1 hypothetical protein [Candidatus Cloacimonadaceae bacterium]